MEAGWLGVELRFGSHPDAWRTRLDGEQAEALGCRQVTGTNEGECQCGDRRQTPGNIGAQAAGQEQNRRDRRETLIIR